MLTVVRYENSNLRIVSLHRDGSSPLLTDRYHWIGVITPVDPLYVYETVLRGLIGGDPVAPRKRLGEPRKGRTVFEA